VVNSEVAQIMSDFFVINGTFYSLLIPKIMQYCNSNLYPLMISRLYVCINIMRYNYSFGFCKIGNFDSVFVEIRL